MIVSLLYIVFSHITLKMLFMFLFYSSLWLLILWDKKPPKFPVTIPLFNRMVVQVGKCSYLFRRTYNKTYRSTLISILKVRFYFHYPHRTFKYVYSEIVTNATIEYLVDMVMRKEITLEQAKDLAKDIAGNGKV